ncbi:MAG: PVC-type heme-binding CxxCH protein [Prosthecobacter sp.]
MRPLLLLLFATSCYSQAKELTGTYLPTTNECPSPEQARAKMTVPEGYEVRCFAHEPMVQNPVAMTWDHRGRLWVVEAYEYPNGSPHPAPFGGEAKDDQYHPVPANCLPKSEIKNQKSGIPRDRVIILEDTDNDGEADKRTVFVQGLNLASAILCGDDGIYIGQQPHLIHFRDADGDDKPDAWRVVLTGFGREDTHELVNSFTWGPDGWLYMTHGVFTNSKVRRPGQPESEGFKFDAGIGRARPLSVVQPSGLRSKNSAGTAEPHSAPPWEFEVFADGTSNPWGCDYDAAGNFFVSACVIDHFFHMAPGGIYVRQGGAPENPYAYEQLPSIVKHKHFRAAYAGVQIYQGGRYPADTHGHAFIGNIHDNAIHEEVLTPVGATFKCEPRRDFLRANDGWFRPVSTQTGPDGFLWIMDWCDKYPCYQNAKANPEGVDRQYGRIWRVVSNVVPASAGQANGSEAPPKGGTTEHASRPSKDLDLKKLSTADLVKTLEHPNNWMRRMARRMLVERADQAAIDLTLTIVKDRNASSQSQLESAFFLSSARYEDTYLGGFIAGREMYRSRLPGVRAASARLWGAIRGWHVDDDKIPPTATAADVLLSEGDALSDSAAEDESVMVRLNAVIALRNAAGFRLTTNRQSPAKIELQKGRRGDPKVDVTEELGKILSANSEADQQMAFAIWMLLEPLLAQQSDRYTRFLATHAGASQPLSRVLSHKAMRRLCDTRKAENLDLAVEFCDKIGAHDILLAHALDGLVKGQEGGVIKPVKDVSASLAKWRASPNADVRKHAFTLAVLWGDEEAITSLAAVLTTAKAPSKEVIEALQRLRGVKTPVYRQSLLQLLRDGLGAHGPEVAVAAIRATEEVGGDEFIPALLQQAAAKDFNVRNVAIATLSSRATWTKALLDAIAEKKVPASGFPAAVRRALATSKDKGIRDLAFKVLGAWQDSSDDVKSLIAQKKQACLTGEPDLANGKLMFTATCMICHEFHGGGQKVGPDLIGSGRSNLDALLANVIDPNQIIGNGYENISVSTKDGRTLAGRIVEDTPGHVKLLGAGGAAQIVSRDQIASLTNTKQSLMPMGFGNLPDAAFRDLIWYILAPPEEGPLTPEKKKLLIQGVELPETASQPKKTNWRAIDWESVSLWNPDWKVNAPDFERTPVKLAEYHGKTNVLLMHPFTDKKTPASLERQMKVEKTKLKVSVAADDRGDWIVKAVVNGQEVKAVTVDHEKPRWKTVEVDLAKWKGQDITLRLEAHANGWAWEFAYWHGITLE